ncbi:MAG: hypothetical protein ABIQ18_18725 [Umezawaea sp.]
MTGSLHPVPGDAQGELHAHPIGKRPKITKLGIICGAILFAFIGGVIYLAEQSDIDLGQCASIVEQSGKPTKLVLTDCASSTAAYKLVFEQSGRDPHCPQGDYFWDLDTGSRKSKSDTMSCYTLNVREGDCLRDRKYSVLNASERVSCSGAQRKVDKIVEGKADTKICTDPATSVSYSNPVRTVCLSKV